MMYRGMRVALNPTLQLSQAQLTSVPGWPSVKTVTHTRNELRLDISASCCFHSSSITPLWVIDEEWKQQMVSQISNFCFPLAFPQSSPVLYLASGFKPKQRCPPPQPPYTMDGAHKTLSSTSLTTEGQTQPPFQQGTTMAVEIGLILLVQPY